MGAMNNIDALKIPLQIMNFLKILNTKNTGKLAKTIVRKRIGAVFFILD